MYRARSLVPGFCNQERTFAKTYNHPVAETPSDLYTLPNVNRDDRHFAGTNQTIRIFQLTQAEWIKQAQESLKTSITQFHRCEPLMTYIKHVMSLDAKGNGGVSPPNIFGPKLTNEQKAELLDAYYWVHMKHQDSHKTVLFYYKLFGWYVRLKDGYRSTKSYDTRQLILKRNELIQKGSISLQQRPKVNPDRVKSARGRKRKSNVTPIL